MLQLMQNIWLGFYIGVVEVVVDVVDVIDSIANDFDFVVAVVSKNIILHLNHKFLFHFP